MEQTPFQRFLSGYCESRLAIAAFVLLMAILFIAVFAPWISPQNPYDLSQLDVLDARLEPGAKLGNGKTALLGTDTEMLGMSVETMRATFLEKMAPTSAEDAALAIVGAIERGRTRLLIGNDARVADLLFRLAPDRAAKWINQHLRRMRGRNRALEEMP